MTHACTTRRAYVLSENYEKGVRTTARSWKRSSVVYLLIFGIMALLFTRLPGGFLPEEDQGMMLALVQGPPGGTLPRTQKALDVVNDHFLKDENANVESVFPVSGFSFNGQGQTAGLAVAKLKAWAEPGGAENQAAAIAGRSMGTFSKHSEDRKGVESGKK